MLMEMRFLPIQISSSNLACSQFSDLGHTHGNHGTDFSRGDDVGDSVLTTAVVGSSPLLVRRALV